MNEAESTREERYTAAVGKIVLHPSKCRGARSSSEVTAGSSLSHAPPRHRAGAFFSVYRARLWSAESRSWD